MYKERVCIMKILYVTFITPSEHFGGGIAILQSLYSLCSFAEVDYVGPEFDINEFQAYGIKPSKIFLVERNKNLLKQGLNLLFRGISTSYYDGWKVITEQLEEESYDCVYLDLTRQDFVLKWAKRCGIPSIVRPQNVEADYFEALYRQQKNLVSYIHKIVGKKSERNCVKFADRVAVLTNSDKKRFIELYGFNQSHYPMFPTCVKHFEGSGVEQEKLPEPFIAITGSFWFGPNASGTEWFLDKVWRHVGKTVIEKYNLVIAGAAPNKRIRELANELRNVYIYENPEKIDVYYQKASIYVAPIFYGAGMKVKIAEALSCGLPVITTQHALAGYEAAKNDIYIGETEEQFLEHLETISNLSIEQFEKKRKDIVSVFESNFSFRVSSQILYKIVSDLLQTQ